MRKIILFFATLLALTVGCQRAEIDPSPVSLEFRDIAVSIGEDATRSLISIEAENFREACLFAFDASSNEVLTYPEHAGDLEGTKPVAIHTTQKSFNWALPVGKALDIYVIVNYGEELGGTLVSYLSNPGLTKSALDALTFTALDNVYMSDIEAAGIPMSGVVHTTLESERSPLNVTVKRLFAKYLLSFDISDLTANNASLQALHVVTENVNTEVPFFQENFKQTVRSKFKEYDRASNLDLEQIQSGQPIVLYVPENCQGSITSPLADKWYDVQGTLGSKVVNCTYVDMSVKIVDADGCWKNYNTALYLGSDCRTNFDVVRNVSTSISVKIPYDVPHIEGQDYFYFDNHDLVTVNGGEDVTLDYSTNLDPTELSFSFTDAASGTLYGDAFVSIVSSGSVRLTANSDYCGHRFIVTGGNASKSAQDQKPVEITSQTIIVNINMTYDWDNYEYVFTADRALPCRIDFKWHYSGLSPSQGYILANRTSNSFAMPSTHDAVESVELWKVNGKVVPPYTYENAGKTYQFVFSIDDSNAEEPLVLEDMEITCLVVSHSELDNRDYTYEGSGTDMNVHVDMHDGNECDLRFSARVKYRGEWHDVLPSDTLTQLLITGFAYPSSTLWVPPGSSEYSTHEWYMPGDVDVVKVYFNDEVVLTFSIYYN